MNLKSLNPKLFEMLEWHKNMPNSTFVPSAKEDIEALNTYAGGKLPQDMITFFKKYWMVKMIPKYWVNHFKCDYNNQSVITYSLKLIPNARDILYATKQAKQGPHYDPEIGARVPEGFLSTEYARGNTSFLFDLRDETSGHIYYLNHLKHQTFDTPGYDWNNIGFVAENFTEFLKGLGTEEDLVAKYGLKVD